ncbi:LppM family (lipo)protein [Brevibacterium senegalense]|uniref:LppM family (lipo)protein n=1 Tax=Brevibacterium senegalense TaxID=1033736 RepID=UPI0013763C1A|nr:hypothetical protein [Brevibacterium senegalense]
MKFNADFQVGADETLTGSMRILVDPVALEDMGSPDPSGELDDSIDEAQNDPEMPDGVTVERVEDEDGYIGMGMTFDSVPASEFQSGSTGMEGVGVDGIEVSQADGEITFTMSNPLVTGMDSGSSFGGSSGMPSTARSMFDEAIVSVGFPGNVVTAEGASIEGKTATWDLRDYDGDTLTAVGEASSFPWGIVFLFGGIVLFLVIVAGVVILILVLRKKKPAPSGGAPFAAAGAPQVQGYPGVQAPQDPGQPQPHAYGNPPTGYVGPPAQASGPPTMGSPRQAPGAPRNLNASGAQAPWPQQGYSPDQGGRPHPGAHPPSGDSQSRFAPPRRPDQSESPGY